MKHLTLSAKMRTETGRGISKRLRAAGQIPAVIYGPSGTTSLVVEEREFKTLLKEKGNSAALVDVKLDNKKKFLSDIADLQRDPITDQFLHVDFHEVVQTEKMTTMVPLEFFGESIGVKINGGILDMARHEVSVRCLPADLPAVIRVDVSSLDIGTIVHFKDLTLPSGVEILGDRDTPVVSCQQIQTSESEKSTIEEAVAAEKKPDSAEEAKGA